MIDPQVAPRQQRLLSLYVTGNLLLVRNRLWSTREFWDPGHGVTALLTAGAQPPLHIGE